jgi:hypothetical protein
MFISENSRVARFKETVDIDVQTVKADAKTGCREVYKLFMISQ